MLIKTEPVTLTVLVAWPVSFKVYSYILVG